MFKLKWTFYLTEGHVISSVEDYDTLEELEEHIERIKQHVSEIVFDDTKAGIVHINDIHVITSNVLAWENEVVFPEETELDDVDKILKGV